MDMICHHGEAAVKLTSADVMQAIESFLNYPGYINKDHPVKVLGIEIHRRGGKYCLTATVLRKDKVKK
jgi:hypothetical protein